MNSNHMKSKNCFLELEQDFEMVIKETNSLLAKKKRLFYWKIYTIRHGNQMKRSMQQIEKSWTKFHHSDFNVNKMESQNQNIEASANKMQLLIVEIIQNKQK